jgi:hypothetical protein
MQGFCMYDGNHRRLHREPLGVIAEIMNSSEKFTQQQQVR